MRMSTGSAEKFSRNQLFFDAALNFCLNLAMGATIAPADLVARALELDEFLADHLGEDVHVAAARPASEGMSAVTIMLTMENSADLVVRCRTGPDSGIDEALQFDLLATLSAVDLPVPRPVLWDIGESPMGVPILITEMMPGSALTPWSRAGRRRLDELGRLGLGERVVALLAAIHGTAPPQSLVEQANLTRDLGGALRGFAEDIDRYAGQPEPGLSDAVAWLEENVPESVGSAIVHGDFRAGNFLFDEDDVSAVLDWELAHVGDPVEDLAWFTSRVNRASADRACDMLVIDEFIEGYEVVSGRRVTASDLGFWRVFVLVRLTIFWLKTSAQWREGRMSNVQTAQWTFNLPRLRLLLLDEIREASD